MTVPTETWVLPRPSAVGRSVSAVEFTVHGVAAPAGSKKGFVRGGRVVITDDSKRSRPWKAIVTDAALKAMETGGPIFHGALLEGPLALDVVFHLPRPKGHHGKRGVLPSAPSHPAVKPDTTKLLRAVEDALTGVVWRDDAQVVEQHAWKVYADDGRARTVVKVQALRGPPRVSAPSAERATANLSEQETVSDQATSEATAGAVVRSAGRQP